MTSSRSRITGKGLHISVQTDILASSNECTLSILYALPASFILDVFQLAELIEENRLTNLTSLRVKALQLQESDLELPFEQVEDRISVAWFDLGEVKEDMRVALPLHLRTHLPQNKERLRNISLREPMVLNSCEAGRFGVSSARLCSSVAHRSLQMDLNALHQVWVSTQAMSSTLVSLPMRPVHGQVNLVSTCKSQSDL